MAIEDEDEDEDEDAIGVGAQAETPIETAMTKPSHSRPAVVPDKEPICRG